MSLLCEENSQLATLTINRPQSRNSLDLETIEQFLVELDRLAALPDLRAVVITGTGERVFCSGADLSAVAMHPEGRKEAMRRYAALLKRLACFERPVIAKVNGHCLAGGMGLLLACDLAVAVDSAQFSLPESAVGMWPMMVGAFLVRELPRKLALELALTGKKLSGAEAVGLGLINRVVPAESLDAAVQELCGSLIRQSPLAVAMGRKAWQEAAALPVGEGLELLALRLGALADTEDALEGMLAFLEKRAPVWKNR
jgi:enoyl-CoA hydratase/carnithine racemase